MQEIHASCDTIINKKFISWRLCIYFNVSVNLIEVDMGITRTKTMPNAPLLPYCFFLIATVPLSLKLVIVCDKVVLLTPIYMIAF